jgi:hypothetical protein
MKILQQFKATAKMQDELAPPNPMGRPAGLASRPSRQPERRDPDRKWTLPFGTKLREAKAAVPLALLSEPGAASWGGAMPARWSAADICAM